MNQSRSMSLIEAAMNAAVGFGLALVVQVIAFRAFGLSASLGDHLGIALLFTAVSIARAYLLRRLFERLRTPLDTEFGLNEAD